MADLKLRNQVTIFKKSYYFRSICLNILTTLKVFDSLYTLEDNFRTSLIGWL